MKCPRCKAPDLQPTMIEEYLPAMGCGTCHGSLVSLLYYRHWAETQKPTIEPAANPDAGASVETTDTTSALTCPKCGRIMMKYKVSGAVSNRVDVCNLCDEAWLDGGEWELLEALQLSHRMPAIFTDEWQRRIRRDLSEETRRCVLARVIGEDGVGKVETFKAWIRDTGRKADIMVYLYRE
jgi:Zn-finger nucleic acid-binding protein